jgi:enterobacterial common antigen flippase
MSYRRILGSTFMMGGASVVNTLLGMLRTKVLAILLGPSGIGLAGIYISITGLLSNLCGMGVWESGVRQIAGAAGSGDYNLLGRTIVAIRRAARISGVIGCGILIFLSDKISRFTFGTGEHRIELAILSAIIIFGAVSSGQTALIQGMRRIQDLARIKMLEALCATVFSIPIIYVFGRAGIPFYLIAVAAASMLGSWWFARKIKTPEIKVSWRNSLEDSKPLLRLGSALMFGTLLIIGTQYILRVLIVHNLGLGAAGIYQSSTTLSVIYVGIILNAMLADFYPRLSEAARDNEECAALINKQIEVGLLLAIPGILVMMTGAPLVISTFYSGKFALAAEILPWQLLGVMLQVVSWPIGFILRAKGNGRLFVLTELFASAAHLSFAWVSIRFLGLPGAGMAFFLMNVGYFFLISFVACKTYSFRFTGASLHLLAGFACAAGFVFLTNSFLPKIAYLFMNSIVTLLVSCYSLKLLLRKTGEEFSFGLLLKLKSSLIS